MTTRIGQPDTDADVQLRQCLDQKPLRSFVMIAGAGSGKTTSLVKALDHLSRTRAAELRSRGQKIACITYTEVAVGEIWGDVGNDPVFHVSTIHSFLWTIVRPFQEDIKRWVAGRLQEKITEAQAKLDSPRTKAPTKEAAAKDIDRYQKQQELLPSVSRFIYGTGSDYAKGVLGHADILKIGPALIQERPLLRNLVAVRFPYIFVDESQDTIPELIDALKGIEQTVGGGFCLGFFGDPMQKIYTTGAGPIELGAGWNEITKQENFRCPTRVLNVINGIRAEDDGLQQIRGRMVQRNGALETLEGSAQLFILPADGQRTERVAQVRQFLATSNDDPLWQNGADEADVRVLVLVHRMAAHRLGFPNIYGALNDKAPSSLKDGLLDGTAWVLRPFLTFLLPLVDAVSKGEDFETISYVRSNCPLLLPERLSGQNVAEVLNRLREALPELGAFFQAGSTATIRDVLSFVRKYEFADLDERFAAYFVAALPGQEAGEENPEAEAVNAFLGCSATELLGYRNYIEDQSPFATQQGIKGAEFERVLVILDDEEGAYNLFSYGKYFGFTGLSAKDQENIDDGSDSVLGRTRRLFYVCCSRAGRDLAVILFVPDVAAAREAILAKGIFRPVDVRGLADIQAAAQ